MIDITNHFQYDKNIRREIYQSQGIFPLKRYNENAIITIVELFNSINLSTLEGSDYCEDIR